MCVPNGTNASEPSPCNSKALAPAGPCAPPGEAWACCPRSALKRCLGLLQSRHGLALKAGFELEFVLLKEVRRAGLTDLTGLTGLTRLAAHLRRTH